jgi:hypothetical protein
LIIKKSVCKSIYFHPGPGIEVPTLSNRVLASKDFQTDLLAHCVSSLLLFKFLESFDSMSNLLVAYGKVFLFLVRLVFLFYYCSCTIPPIFYHFYFAFDLVGGLFDDLIWLLPVVKTRMCMYDDHDVNTVQTSGFVPDSHY